MIRIQSLHMIMNQLFWLMSMWLTLSTMIVLMSRMASRMMGRMLLRNPSVASAKSVRAALKLVLYKTRVHLYNIKL